MSSTVARYLLAAMSWAACLLINAQITSRASDDINQGQPMPARSMPRGAMTRFGLSRTQKARTDDGVRLAPDGKTLAIVGYGGEVKLVEWRTGKTSGWITLLPGLTIGSSGEFSPDGQFFATVDSERHVRLCDVPTRQWQRVLPAGDENCEPLAFSEDGRLLAYGPASHERQAQVRLWSVHRREYIGAFPAGHGARAALSRTGRVLATWAATSDPEQSSKVRLWAVERKRHLATIDVGYYEVSAVSISPDGQEVAVGLALGFIQIFDLATGAKLREMAFRVPEVTSLLYSRDGTMLSAIGRSGRVAVSKAKARAASTIVELPGKVESAVWARDGLLVCTNCGHVLRFWDGIAGKEVAPSDGHTGHVDSIVFSSDGKVLTSASFPGEVCVSDVTTGRILQKMDAETDVGTLKKADARADGPVAPCCAISPSGRYMLRKLGGLDGKLRLSDVVSGKVRHELEGVCSDRLVAAFSPREDRVVFGSLSSKGAAWKAVCVWDLRTGEVVKELPCEMFMHLVDAVAVSGNGKLVAAAVDDADTKIFVWDLQTGHPVCDFSCGKRAGYFPITFSEDGSLFALAGPMANVELWNPVKGARVRVLDVLHGRMATALAFSPDGRDIALATYDSLVPSSKIELLDVATGSIRGEFQGHEGRIGCLAFSRDGRILASGGWDTSILLWNLRSSPGSASPTDAGKGVRESGRP